MCERDFTVFNLQSWITTSDESNITGCSDAKCPFLDKDMLDELLSLRKL